MGFAGGLGNTQQLFDAVRGLRLGQFPRLGLDVAKQRQIHLEIVTNGVDNGGREFLVLGAKPGDLFVDLLEESLDARRHFLWCALEIAPRVPIERRYLRELRRGALIGFLCGGRCSDKQPAE